MKLYCQEKTGTQLIIIINNNNKYLDVVTGSCNLDAGVGDFDARELNVTVCSFKIDERFESILERRLSAANSTTSAHLIDVFQRPSRPARRQPHRLDPSTATDAATPGRRREVGGRTGTTSGPQSPARQTVENVVAEAEPVSRLVVVQVADVDDDDADEYLERDAGDQHGQHEVVEPMTLATDVEQQFEFGDLCQRQNGDERGLRLGLRLFQLAVTGQQLSDTNQFHLNYSQ